MTDPPSSNSVFIRQCSMLVSVPPHANFIPLQYPPFAPFPFSNAKNSISAYQRKFQAVDRQKINLFFFSHFGIFVRYLISAPSVNQIQFCRGCCRPVRNILHLILCSARKDNILRNVFLSVGFHDVVSSVLLDLFC